MVEGHLGEIAKIDEFEYLAILTAACVHDFEHPGVNNIFLSKIQDPVAVRYNDQSVLENHHIAAAFEVLLGDPTNNWAERFELTDFTRIRSLMIDCVLATDMAIHFRETAHFKERLSQPEFDVSKQKDKLMTIKLFFHFADISNPAKPWMICKDWTDLLYVEFFA